MYQNIFSVICVLFFSFAAVAESTYSCRESDRVGYTLSFKKNSMHMAMDGQPSTSGDFSLVSIKKSASTYNGYLTSLIGHWSSEYTLTVVGSTSPAQPKIEVTMATPEGNFFSQTLNCERLTL
jgi:hypothetical protein